MEEEKRSFFHIEGLGLELYRFEGLIRSFPNHFHEHYSIGLMERGKRQLSCRNQSYEMGAGDILLLNPGDNHTCQALGGEQTDYCGLNFSRESMAHWTKEVSGQEEPPVFTQTVVRDSELSACLAELQQAIRDGANFEAEELLLFFLAELLRRYSCPWMDAEREAHNEVAKACMFLEEHFEQSISLEQLCRHVGLSKSSLLRAFTREKGITPYRYLQTVRINRAKQLLEQGIQPTEAALATGFSDQSHFTRFFRMFIGTTPGTYQEMFSQKEKGGA